MKNNLGVLEIDNFYLSRIYEEGIEEEKKKSNGVYYTPKVIVRYIMEKTLEKHDILKNPCPRILDISCGCGNFLLEAYDILYDLIESKIYDLRDKYNDEYWCIDNIHKHIVENCIFGVDIDNKALEILKNGLSNKSSSEKEDKTKYSINIYCEDGLKKEWDFKFDYIVGNPPYVGHKSLDKDYKKYLLKEYNSVYRDKSDLYFCFYKRVIDLINQDGTISMITPRYFLESPSGVNLRKYIKENSYIEEIVDFLGANIFKNIGIAGCIVTLKPIKYNNFKEDHSINIYKIKDENIKINEVEDLSSFINSGSFENFYINQNLLEEDWIITNPQDREFYKKIQCKCKYELDEIATSFQGIITGCDKAFIIENSNEISVPKNLLKVWVKNKNIRKYIIDDTKYRLIYSNDIDDEELYQNTIKKHIEPYRVKLENRRECKKNIRKWYELQWGREKYLFEQEKIMYPYKSKCNRFAIDHNNSYCSADVYSFFIKEKYKNEFSNEYLVGVLNSQIYNKYFKIIAKCMGKDIYDYYPNKVMKIKIFKDNNYKKIEELSKKIIFILKNKNTKYSEDELEIKLSILEEEINKLIKESLQI